MNNPQPEKKKYNPPTALLQKKYNPPTALLHVSEGPPKESIDTVARGGSGSKKNLADMAGIAPSFATLGAIFLYAMLITGYSQFYRRIGIRPEEVGLNYTAVLSRSIGYVLVALIAAAIFLIVCTVESHILYGISTWASWGRLRFSNSPSISRSVARNFFLLIAILLLLMSVWAASAAGAYIIASSSLDWGYITRINLTRAEIYVYIMPTLVAVLGLFVAFRRGFCFPKPSFRRNLILAVLLGFYLPSILLFGRASAMGRSLEVKPYKILGISIFDIKTERTKIAWVGDGGIPPILSKEKGKLVFYYLGQNSGTAIIAYCSAEADFDSCSADAAKVLRVPLSSIVMET